MCMVSSSRKKRSLLVDLMNTSSSNPCHSPAFSNNTSKKLPLAWQLSGVDYSFGMHIVSHCGSQEDRILPAPWFGSRVYKNLAVLENVIGAAWLINPPFPPYRAALLTACLYKSMQRKQHVGTNTKEHEIPLLAPVNHRPSDRLFIVLYYTPGVIAW